MNRWWQVGVVALGVRDRRDGAGERHRDSDDHNDHDHDNRGHRDDRRPAPAAGGIDVWPVVLLVLLLGAGSGGYYAWREGHLDAYLGDLNGPGGRD